jgi:sulfate adenylyltransferase subunit 2
MIEFRYATTQRLGLDLLVHVYRSGVGAGINPFDYGASEFTHVMKTHALKQALLEHRFDAAIGGARRDEEISRAKERIFSFRTGQQLWDPKNQRPEMWQLYNTRIKNGESIRVFPLSNWTELDVWQYILVEDINVVPLYLAAKRPVVERDGLLLMRDDERMVLGDRERVTQRMVRFRTLGCYPLTGAIESDATDVGAVVREIQVAKTSERKGRAIDHDEEASMENKKREGYF